jgi:hypothetical protein
VRADDAVTLTRTYKEGTVLKYKTVNKVDANGMDVVLKHGDKITVKEIKPDGQVVTEHATGAGTLTIGGQDQEVPAGAPVTETYDKTGKLATYKADHADETYMSAPVQNLLEIAAHVILTDKPVKTGDTWQTEVDNPAVKGKKITIKGTYLGIEKKDGVDLWKIKQTLEADTGADGAKLTAEQTSYLDPADGHDVKSTADIKGVPTMYGVLNFKVEVALAKDDADTKKEPAVK